MVKNVDVLLVGAGVMSSTLGVLLKKLDPALSLCMVERLNDVAEESSDGWNNAGTGHAAYCELNYTPEHEDGSISIDKALAINASFEISLQFWSSLVAEGDLPEPSHFINPVPHISFVWGEENVEFLRKRYEAMREQPLFKGMEFSDDPDTLREWIPLVMAGRDTDQAIAATRIRYGADVDFGSLTHHLVDSLRTQTDFELQLHHEVTDLQRQNDGRWSVSIRDRNSGVTDMISAGFVFLGAGGGALHLLQLSGIPEAKGYGGFPVSGQWLVCRKPEVVEQHEAKVYGKATIGAPPMSVPHLDTRVIDGEKTLLFGPFAGFTTKFLKRGSFLDLVQSIRPSNLWPMLKVGLSNFDLVRYLITEVLQSQRDRVKALRDYYPEAEDEDWTLQVAGQRVQIIKKDPQAGGKLEFGT